MTAPATAPQMLCLGVNFRTSPVSVREKFAVLKGRLVQANQALCALPGVQECVLLSTCNRTEIYLWATDCALALDSVAAYLLGSPGHGARDCFYSHRGTAALQHLATVAAGMDSMVIGETEIFGQLKDAYRAAQEAGTTAAHANRTFQHIFTIGKRVRSSTRITSGPTSVGAASVQLAQQVLGSLAGSRVLLVGAGEVARTTARSLASRGAEHIFVANRSYDRAVDLAAQVGGRVIRFSEWIPYLENIDIVIVSTASPVYVVSPAVLEQVQAVRQRPLFLIDLSVPRNVDPACALVQDVHVYDMDAMQAMAAQTLEVRCREIERGAQMIADWVQEEAPLLLGELSSPSVSADNEPLAVLNEKM